MPKFPTFPTLYNEVLQLQLTRLKQWGYLNPGQIKSGTLTWSRNGNKTGSISILVNTQHPWPYIELDYKCNDEPRNYKVYLASIPSNIGKGLVWYFLCPNTGKRCRILYSVGGYFLHRDAFKGCMYESQTYSHKNREMIRIFEKATGSDKAYDQLYSKHFKKYYAGKPTKKYLRIMKQIRASEQFSYEDIEAMYLI